MAITSALCNSFKQELLEAGHCLLQTMSPTASATSGSMTLTSVSSVAGTAIGMHVTGTNIPANTIITGITASTLTISAATTGIISAATLTITSDQYFIALFKSGVSGTYGAATTNYSQMLSGSDEASGTNYTAGGKLLVPTAPSFGTTNAYVQFANVAFSNLTTNTDGALIYNASARIGTTTGRAVAVINFGSTQSPIASTFNIVLPSNDQTNALIRIG